MQFKTRAFALAVAASLLSVPAWAVTQESAPLLVQGNFQDRVLDTFVLGGLSDIEGSITWATGNVEMSFGAFTFSAALVDGSGTSFSLGSYADQDSAPLAYRFDDVAAGTYQLLVSGSSSGFSAMRSVSDISAVPEPESYAMLLAGLGVLGFVGRRRSVYME